MMWTRKEIKEHAKEALKRNYWKAVLVSFILIILGGGIHSASAARAGVSTSGDSEQETIYTADGEVIVLENGDRNELGEPETRTYHEVAEDVGDAVTEAVDTVLTEIEGAETAVIIVLCIVYIMIFIIALAVVVLFDAFVLNPLCIGAKRFMLKSVDGMGKMSELGYAFDHDYKNCVKAAFIRDLHIGLGFICFIIPGIYMKYQYYMVDYILAENPDMPYKDVLACSKNMMNGQKWNAFVLDISFILWHMLSSVTCGILEVFYVEPYIQLTRASLYRRFSDEQLRGNYQNTINREVIIDAE